MHDFRLHYTYCRQCVRLSTCTQYTCTYLFSFLVRVRMKVDINNVTLVLVCMK